MMTRACWKIGGSFVMCHDYAIFVQQLPRGICIKSGRPSAVRVAIFHSEESWSLDLVNRKLKLRLSWPRLFPRFTGELKTEAAAHAPRRVTAQFGQKTSDRRQKTADCRLKTEDSGQKTAPNPGQKRRHSEPAGCRRL